MGRRVQGEKGAIEGPNLGVMKHRSEAETIETRKGSTDRLGVYGGLGLVALSFLLQLPLVRFPETDAFYHLRHASVYAQEGLLHGEFPWHTQSLVGDLGADLWYGFHLALIPFSWIPDPMLSLRVASAASLAFLLLSFFWLARRTSLPMPMLWPVLLIGCSPPETWRWLGMRPFLVSLGLASFLMLFALRGRRAPIALLSGGISFAHASFFWLGPAIALCVFVATSILERKRDFALPLLAIAGALAGLILRPNGWDVFPLLKAQLIDLGTLLRTSQFVSFGGEIYSLIKLGKHAVFLPFLALWLFAILFVWARAQASWRSARPEWRIAFAATFPLALVFAAMSFFQTHRAAEPWVFFAVLSVGLTFAIAVPSVAAAQPASTPRRTLVGFAGASLLLSGASFGISHKSINDSGFNLYRLEPAMTWLSQNSAPGDIVYHTDWGLFAEMFFWNTHNHYITGMDPIFLYAHDRRRFWQFTGIELDVMTSQVIASAPDRQPVPEDTFTVMRRDFGARFALVCAEYTPRFLAYLRSDPRFREVFESPAATVFELAGK